MLSKEYAISNKTKLSEGTFSPLTSEDFCNLGAGWTYVNFFQRCLSMNCVFFPQMRTIVTTCRLNDIPEGICAWKTLRSGWMTFISMFVLIQTQRPLLKKNESGKKRVLNAWNLFLEYLHPMNDIHMHVLLSHLLCWGTAQQPLVKVWVRQETLQSYHSRSAVELKTKPIKTKQNRKTQTKTHSHLYGGFILYFF